MLSFKRYEGAKKIMIIWMAEFLGTEGNRLLKLIEEPPEDTQFILIAENTEKVLNTILSRCQLIKFNKISDIALSKYLASRYGMSEERAKEVAFFSNGNMLDAISSIEQVGKGEFDLFHPLQTLSIQHYLWWRYHLQFLSLYFQGLQSYSYQLFLHFPYW